MNGDSDDSSDQANLFNRLPGQYYHYCLEWFSYPNWSVDETANLLAGCVPHRRMFMKGDDNKQLDQLVLETENKIRAALGADLKVVKTPRYSGKTYIDSANVVEWALSNDIVVPRDLAKAEEEIRRSWQTTAYSTPCMKATEWVVANFWEQANLRMPPRPATIIEALRWQFPELSSDERESVEMVTRHPHARDDT